MVESPCVSIQGIVDHVMPRKPPHADPVCQIFEFRAYHPEGYPCLSKDDPICCLPRNLSYCLEMTMEESGVLQVKVVAIARTLKEILHIRDIETVKTPGMQVDQFYMLLEEPDEEDIAKAGKYEMLDLGLKEVQERLATAHLCIVLSSASDEVTGMLEFVSKDAFFLLVELTKDSGVDEILTGKGYDEVASFMCHQQCVYLYRKPPDTSQLSVSVVQESAEGFAWVEELQQALKDVDIVWLVCQHNPDSGVIGFVKSFRQETNGEKIR
jgi:hypothetical protein